MPSRIITNQWCASESVEKEAVCQAHALQDACPAAAFCFLPSALKVAFLLFYIPWYIFAFRSSALAPFLFFRSFADKEGLGHLILRLLHCTLCIGALCSSSCCRSTLLSRLGLCASVYLKRSAHTENPSGISFAPITILHSSHNCTLTLDSCL